jgi:bacterioferritin-associated ferredoxin
MNDHAILEAAVAADATAPEELADLCGAGARCGGCLPALRALLDELHGDRRPAHASAA